MSYHVPQYIDKNKIFIVNRSDTEGRWDPLFYGSNFSKFFIHPYSTPLKEVCTMFLSGFGAGKKEQTTKENGFIQIRPTNIDNDGFLKFDKNVYVPYQDGTSFLRKGTVLFNNTNSQDLVGKTGLLLDDAQLYSSNHITSIIVDERRLIPEYLWIILNLYQWNKVFYSICTNWNNQSGVGIELLKSLKVPVPPLATQHKIVDYYVSVCTEKQQGDYEAQQLLENIDTYLLDVLNVSIYEPKTDLDSRQFIIKRSALEGRLDPSVYKDGIKLVSEKYDNVKLSSCAWINPNTSFKGKNAETTISFIPMEVIDECYSEVTSMSEKTIGESSGFTRFQNGDLLWAKITPCMQNGKSVVVRDLTNGLGCGSTEFFIIRPRTSQLSIDYLQALLHMKAIRKTAMLYFGGSAGQQRVSVNFLENFNVPLPPIEKQEEIAHHVAELRQKAKALQQEGRLQLEKTKQEVEQMIIG